MTWPSRYVYVLAIEGVDTVLTNSDAVSAVAAAWAGTDWTSATSGLFVDLDQKQSGNPWEPFQPGGTVVATIADEAIGVLMHRTAGGAETVLAASLNQTDTTITVKDTSAFPSSGTLHIGTEAIAYAGKTSTTFTGCTRGKHSPFGTGSGLIRYAHNHRVGVTGPYSPDIQPHVTQYPRTWIGRWVGLWVHGYNSDGTLQTKASAQRVFAGRLAEVKDDEEFLSTVLTVEHVLTDLREATVGRDMLSGEIADGIYLPAGAAFAFADHNGTSQRTANALTVVSGVAVGANQMSAGLYSHAQLFTKWAQWTASELAAGRLWGTYSFGIAPTQGTPESQRAKVYWKIPGSGTVLFGFVMPKAVAIFLGFDDSDPSEALGTLTVSGNGTPGATHHKVGKVIPLRSWVTTGLSTAFLRMQNASGAFQDQLSTFPASCMPTSATGMWGLFKFDDQVLVRARVVDNLDGTLDLFEVKPVLTQTQVPYSQPPLGSYRKTIDDFTPTTIRQVFLFEMRAGEFLNRLAYSGGTVGYNQATYDVLPYGCGLAYPGELFGAAWETSIANVPGADKLIAPLIDKPTKIATLVGSDLVLRHVFPVWKSGGLRMGAWQTPTTSLAIASLTEDNKAEPSGRDVNHRSPTLLSGQWAKNVIKIEYDRDVSGDSYNSTINVEDRTAIDDVGDRGSPFTIEARNTFAQLAATGAGIEDLVPNVFIPVVRLFTKPLRTLKRSVDLSLWDLAPGDIVKVSDGFARDPTTGIRKVSNRPAIVISHRYNPGGARPDKSTAPIVAEVELMFIETNRIYAYSPSALIDNTANAGGFTAGYNAGSLTIRCVPHAYSEASESVDAASIAAGDAATIHEIDPATPGSVLNWFANVISVSGNDIGLDTALTSFDANKRYRIIPALYGSAQTSQREKAFQASGTNGLVANAAQAYQFGLVTSPINATPSQHTDLPERHAALTHGDGAPYDVGSIVGFSRLVDNLIDHKTAIQSPVLSSTVLSNTTYSTGTAFRLVAMMPIYLSAGGLSNSIVRYVKVAPWLRSSDGTATSVRVSLCTFPYVGSTLNDIDRSSPLAEATWNTSSTTWSKPSGALLAVNVKSMSGYAWLLVECKYKSECRVLAEFTEQERMVF